MMEARILISFIKGKRIKEIAFDLERSHRSIECYLDNIYIKSGCFRRDQLNDLFGPEIQALESFIRGEIVDLME